MGIVQVKVKTYQFICLANRRREEKSAQTTTVDTKYRNTQFNSKKTK